MNRRDILKRGLAVLTAGAAVKPWVKPASLIERHAWYLAALQKAYAWPPILAGIDFAYGPDKAYITLGRMDADGKLTILETREYAG